MSASSNECPTCGKSYCNKYNLRRHQEMAHNIKCSTCHLVFDDKSELVKQKNRAHREHCPYCMKVFVTKSYLNEHKLFCALKEEEGQEDYRNFSFDFLRHLRRKLLFKL